jgi:hypothetical protein
METGGGLGGTINRGLVPYVARSHILKCEGT